MELSQETYEKAIGEVSDSIGYTERLSSPVISLIERSRDGEDGLPATKEDLRRYLLACKRHDNVRVHQTREESLYNKDGEERQIDSLRETESGESKYYFEKFIKSLFLKKDKFLCSAYFVSGLSTHKILRLGLMKESQKTIYRRLRFIADEYGRFLSERGLETKDLRQDGLWTDVVDSGRTYFRHRDGEDLSPNINPLKRYRRTKEEKDLIKFREESRLSRERHLKKMDTDGHGVSCPLGEDGRRDLKEIEKVKSPETSLFTKSGRCLIPLGKTEKEDGKKAKESLSDIRRLQSLESAYLGKRTDSCLDMDKSLSGVRIYETFITPEKERTFTGFKKDKTPFKVHTGIVSPETIETAPLGKTDGLKRQRQYLAIKSQEKEEKDGEDTDTEKVKRTDGKTRTRKTRTDSGRTTILRKRRESLIHVTM